VKGAGVFVLDVISNTLGAVLLIFLLVAPKLLDRPAERREDTLVVRVRAADGEAVVRLWLQPPGPPGSAERYFCNPNDPAKKDAFEMAKHTRAFAQAEEGTESGEDEAVSTRPPAALWLRPVGTGSSSALHSCAILVRDPAPGCWSYGAVYADHLRLQAAADIEVSAWLSGASLVVEGDTYRPAPVEEGGGTAWPKQIFELLPSQEATGSIVVTPPGGNAPGC